MGRIGLDIMIFAPKSSMEWCLVDDVFHGLWRPGGRFFRNVVDEPGVSREQVSIKYMTDHPVSKRNGCPVDLHNPRLTVTFENVF